jgi:hypothetical protein
MDTFLDSNSHNVACADASVWQPSEYWFYGDRRVSATRLTFDATRRVSGDEIQCPRLSVSHYQVDSYHTAIIRCLVRHIAASDSDRLVAEAYRVCPPLSRIGSSQGQFASMNDHIMSALGGETTDESYE